MKSKIRLQHALVFSIFLYACETWTLTVELQRKITAVEMRCYRRLLGISYTEHVTNDEVRRRIEEQIGPFVDLLTAVKRRKLRWYGHVTRSNGLSKTVLQGTVQGRRRWGGPWKQWVDNIKEWMGLTFMPIHKQWYKTVTPGGRLCIASTQCTHNFWVTRC